MAIQGFFTGDVKIKDLNGILRAVDGIVDVISADTYVPYTGAITSVDLGANNITAQNFLSNGTGSVGGYMAFKQYSTSLSGIPGYTSIYAVTQNDLHIRYSQSNGSQKIAQLSSAILGTTPRQYLFPDKDGTFALVGDIINLTFSSPLVNNSGVVSIPVATGSVNGYLSSTDWTTFNNKQNALNGTGFVKISGTTISYDNSTYYLASNPNAYIPLTALSFVAGSGAYNNTTGVITIPTNTSQLTNGANFITLVSLSGTAPIQYNNTTGAISITQSGSSSNGFLSSTDWNTFNSKQGAITLTTTGSSGAATLIGTTLNIPNYGSVIGNYVPYTGATNDVNLGVYTLSANSINIIGPGLGGLGGGYLGLKQNLSVLYGGGEYTSLTGEGKVYLSMYFSQDSIGTNYKLGRFDVSALTNNTQRTYSLPDASGTIALTSQLTSGTVTSVAASITGNSISISGSPIVTAGTLAFSFAGNATQYVRGDGALATLPTSGSGGGASVSYYLNGSINQGTIGGVTYYEMNRTPVIGTGTDFSISSNGYIASFLTDANDPALLNIPAGNFNFETYFEASSGGGTPTFYIELYKYDGTTFTLIASNSTNPKIINSGTSVEAYFTALAVPQTTLTLTDRLAIRIYVTTAGRTITLHTEDSNLCQVITTFTTGLTALNGLTSQVQYFATGTSGSDFNISSATATHTFNLPTASATNRGALASADWTTFNNKQNALTLTTTGTSGAATLVGATLNIPQYQSVLTNPVTGTGTTNYLPKFTGTSTIGNSQIFDDGTNVGIGTASPSYKLDVNGAGRFTGVLYADNTVRVGNAIIGINLNNLLLSSNTTGGEISFWNGQLANRLMTLNGSGNLSIGNTNDTYKLDVSGTGRFTGQLRLDSTITNGTYTYTLPSATGTIALVGGSGVGTVTSIATTGPITGGTITSTGTIGITQSGAASDGYLSSTDWNTFYNKQAAGSYITALTGEATASGPGSATVTLSTSAVTGKLLTGLNLTGGGSIAATDSILQAFGKVQNQISGLAGGVTFQGTWNASTNTPTLTSSVGTKGYYYIVDVAGSTNLNGITDWKVGDWAIFNGSTWDKVDNTDAVSSVNGFTGAVSLTTSNIAEGTNLYYLDSRARLALSFTAGSGAYNNITGVITIPTNTSQLTNGANFITLSSLSASSPLAYNSGTGAFSIQVATGSQNGYLSSTDWTTFNNKQNALTNPVTGTGTTNYLPKFTGTSTIGNSTIFDNGGNIGINNTNSYNKLDIVQVGSNNAVTGVGLKIVSDAGNSASMALSQSARGTATIGMQASGAAPCNFVIGTDVTGAFLFKKGLGGTGGTDLSTGTTQMTLDASGNLGLGVTPSAWTINPAFQIKDGGSLWALNNQNLWLSQNVYFDGSYRYIASVPASQYVQSSGGHVWYQAPSGTAGNAISFTQAMTLLANGRLLVNTTSDAGNYSIQANGNIASINSSASGLFSISGTRSIGIQSFAGDWNYLRSNGANLVFGTQDANTLYIRTSDVDRLTIASTGAATFSSSVGIGISPITKLHLQGSSPNYILLTNTAADGVANAIQGGIIGQSRGYANNLAQMASILFRNENSAAWYRGEITFNTNGTDGTDPSITPTERMRITSGGNVGIGTTSPGNRLEVNGGSIGSNIARFTTGGGGGGTRGMNIFSNDSYVKLQVTDNSGSSSTWAHLVLNPDAGYVGVGTTSPAYKLEVYNDTSDKHIAAVGAAPSLNLMSTNTGGANWGTVAMATATNNFIVGASAGDLIMLNRGSTAGNMLFGFGSSEKMRLTSNGDLCINATATTASAKLYVNGTAAFGSVYVASLGTGTVYSNAGTLTNTNPSDRRLKTNIIPLTYGLSDILKLKPVSYNWKDGTNGKQFGFIAQEVQEIMPDAVKQGEYLGLEKDAIYSALVNAIKEQQAQINELKSQLNK